MPRAWSARPLPDDAIARGENLCSPYSDSLRPSHRLRRGAGAAGAQPPCDLGLCLAHRSQKRRARCLVRRNLQMTNDDVYPTGCAVHRVLGLSPVRLLGCPKRRIRPGGTSRRYAKRPWSRASLAVGGRALGDRTQRCRPFAKPSPPGDSGDVTACHAARFTENDLMDPFRSGPRSLSSPSTVGPGALAPMGAPAFSEFPRPGDPASRGAALAREPPSPSPLLSHALPREHDLNAIELRSARRSPLAGVRRRTAHEESPPRGGPLSSRVAPTRCDPRGGQTTSVRHLLRTASETSSVAGRSGLP